jgi:biotin carboxyl carrier protein
MEVPADAKVEAVRDRTGLWVWADGVSAHLVPAGAVGPGGGGDEVRSPMTGTVVSVSVRAGDAVKAGAPLVVVTAMKMEFRIEAPRDGVVKEAAAKPGDRVELGAVLVRLEP